MTNAVYIGMPKRKFEEHNAAEGKPNGVSNGALRMQRERLDAILEQAKKTLSRALKVARGFERQKLGRRQKVAKEQKDDAETVRLIAEVTALKVCCSKILLVYAHTYLVGFRPSLSCRATALQNIVKD